MLATAPPREVSIWKGSRRGKALGTDALSPYPPRQTLPCPSRASGGAFEVRISIFFEHWLEVQLSPADAALEQALSERAIRANWPSAYNFVSATLSLLAVFSPW